MSIVHPVHGHQITKAKGKMNIGHNIQDKSLHGQNKLGQHNRPPISLNLAKLDEYPASEF